MQERRAFLLSHGWTRIGASWRHPNHPGVVGTLAGAFLFESRRQAAGMTNYGDDGLASIAIEGVCDFFFGRPFDENPYARDWANAWGAWREGWLAASSLELSRGQDERRRWLAAA